MATKPATPSCVANGDIVAENLPLPVVHYPRRQGTFLAFALDRRSAPALCACAQGAVEHLLRLRPDLLSYGDVPGGPDGFFPPAITRRVLQPASDGAPRLRFVAGICHRCNDARPSLCYCEESQASGLMPAYGWYVNQVYLELGILPSRTVYLEEVCPAGYRDEIDTVHRLERAFSDECSRLFDAIIDGTLAGRARTETWYADQEEIAQMVDLRQRASNARRDLKLRIEAAVMRQMDAGGSPFIHA
jgi:hypothetical protein